MGVIILESEISKQQDFYNERWANSTVLNSLKLKRCVAILGAMSSTNIKTPRILDLGSGDGWLTSIAGMFGQALGVDLSDRASAVSSAKYPYASFICADIMNWDYKGDLFDIVISQEVIEHVEDQEKYLQIACNLIRPGGFLILTTPNKYIFDAFSDQQRKSWSNQPIEKLLSIPDLKKLIGRKFSVIKLESIITGYDAQGVLRVLNSQKLRNFMDVLGMRRIYDHLYLKAGYGLHLILIAKK